MIPALIHQTWKHHTVPARFLAAQASWRRHHPDWEYRFWTDDDLTKFVARHYPQHLDLFLSYPDQIQRVDAARYMILHHFGGFYADLDIVCEKPFDDLRGFDVMLPATEPMGVSNDLMGGYPRSGFFAHAVAQLPRAKRRWPRRLVPRHFRVLLTTGSLFLTQALRTWRGQDAPFILSAEHYSIAGHPQAFDSHIAGSTWHGRDSDLILGVFYRIKTLLEKVRAALGFGLKK